MVRSDGEADLATMVSSDEADRERSHGEADMVAILRFDPGDLFKRFDERRTEDDSSTGSMNVKPIRYAVPYVVDRS